MSCFRLLIYPKAVGFSFQSDNLYSWSFDSYTCTNAERREKMMESKMQQPSGPRSRSVASIFSIGCLKGILQAWIFACSVPVPEITWHNLKLYIRSKQLLYHLKSIPFEIRILWVLLFSLESSLCSFAAYILFLLWRNCVCFLQFNVHFQTGLPFIHQSDQNLLRGCGHNWVSVAPWLGGISTVLDLYTNSLCCVLDSFKI